MRRAAAAVTPLVALVVCASAGAVTSQQPPATIASTPVTASDVDAQVDEGMTLLKASRINEAKERFARALEAARGLALEPQEASALCSLAEASSAAVQYREAREMALQCLELYERLSLPGGMGRAHLILCDVADASGDRSESRMRVDRALAAYEAAGDRRGRALATHRFLTVNRPPRAEADRLRARALEDAVAVGDQEVEARVLHHWGDALFNAGELEHAFEQLERAAALYEQGGHRAALGTVYNSIGRVYRGHGRLAEALRFQLKALDLHQAVGDPYSLMQSLNAVGAVYSRMGRLPEAQEFYERALAVAEQSSSPRVQDTLRGNLAAVLTFRGKFERAETILEGIIERGLDPFPYTRQTWLARARLGMGRAADALAPADRAVDSCRSTRADCADAFRARAAVKSALGQHAAALDDIESALAVLEGLRANLVPTDFFKQEFHRAIESTYSLAIAYNLQQRHDERALETAELARSRAFLDLLATRTEQRETPPLVFRGPQPGPGQGADLPSSTAASPASARDVAAIAARLDSTLVLYWVAQDEVFIWVVTPKGRIEVKRVKVLQSRVEDLVRTTSPVSEGTQASAVPASTSALTTRGAEVFAFRTPRATAWRELYDLLILPVRDALPRSPGALVTIVPMGPLLNLSFAALQDPRGRYLLEDFTVHYAPAAAMLQLTGSRPRPEGRMGDMLLVADPALPVLSRLDRPLPRLPGARAEAQAIARLVPRPRVTMLGDTRATEDDVRVAAGGKAVLHLATHAIVRDDEPFASFLALGPASGGTGADGRLTAQEVYDWRLNADLVVLSACRSAGGRVTGDGVATFARAFIYAGTPSLVASLWDVPDEPTNRLLPLFYRAWLGGQSKAHALRTAQLQVLRDLRAERVRLQTPAGPVLLPEHPIFWAGFALIGEPD